MDEDLRAEHPPGERRGLLEVPEPLRTRPPDRPDEQAPRSAVRREGRAVPRRVGEALADHDGKLDRRYTNDGLHLMGPGYLVWRDAIKIHVK